MKIVVAYSGGLDTSIILIWLKEKYNAEIIAFCADIGQEEELKGLDKKALKTGASKCYIDDLTEEFASDFIYPMIRANALYENQYFLGTSIARPLIAKRQVEIARLENADAVAHGATGKGNDQVRFELTFAALAPDLKIIAPWRDWDFKGRTDLMAYAKSKGISVPVSAKKPYSTDRNLLHISFESGILEDPWIEPPADMFKLSVSPEKAPDKAQYVELDFVAGDCVAVDGKKLSPANVLRTLNKLGGKHGIGRVDLVENRFVGMKSRGVYETPGGAILHFAHPPLLGVGLLRFLVRAGTGISPGGGRGKPEICHRHRAAQALQGQPHRRGTQEQALPLQPRRGHDGSRPGRLQPGRCHRLHPAQRAPVADAVQRARAPEKEIARGHHRSQEQRALGAVHLRANRRGACSR